MFLRESIEFILDLVQEGSVGIDLLLLLLDADFEIAEADGEDWDGAEYFMS